MDDADEYIYESQRCRSCHRKTNVKRRPIFGALILMSSVAFACEPETTMRSAAIRSLYADADIARYVCIDHVECSIEEFSRQMEVKPVKLNTEGTPAIQIEPRRKGNQYFSALFLREQCKYNLVFAPDTTLSSVKLLKTKKHNFYVLRAVERESTEAWKEYDFSYDLESKRYGAPTTRCFRAGGAKAVRMTCE